MKGLVLKDLINLKKQFNVIGLLIVFYFIFSKVTNSNSMFSTMVIILFAMLPITALAFDEKANWDKYGLTMPVSRSEVVISKYVLGLIASIATVVLNFVAQILLGTEINADSLMTISLMFGISIIFFSLLLPIIFKFGVEKGRLMMFAILALPTLIVLLFKDRFDIINSQDLLNKAMYALPILSIAILILSILISIAIYKGKEF